MDSVYGWGQIEATTMGDAPERSGDAWGACAVNGRGACGSTSTPGIVTNGPADGPLAYHPR
jgi:hypothetical protein